MITFKTFLKTAAKVLLVFMLLAIYLVAGLALLADSFSPLGVLFLITLHVLYSWGVVWFYAFLKVRDRPLWALLLMPVLTTTSTIGIVLWMIFQPEAKIRKQKPD
ncbi:hypothetical protein H6F86_15940 [Phormidium sp. FACHB-592]|uniref:DUF3817 domain-containing protein n=2 Tax=Cyanobacteriota TaxID=1117 RepID=A0ABV0KKV8_9CYAN|nr:hypothetical protein [Phormidium sp. FACHB-592]